MVEDKIIEELLKIDEYKKAILEASKLIEDIKQMKAELIEIKNSLGDLLKKIKEIDDKVNNFFKTYDNKIEELRRRYIELDDSIENIKAEIENINKKVEEFTKNLEKEIELRKESELKYEILIERLKSLL